MSYSMSDLLQLVVSEGASDLHIRVGRPPTIRVHGILHRVEGPPLTPEDSEELMRSITSEDHIQQVREHGGADFGFAFGETARFRVSVFKEKGNFGMVLRQIPEQDADVGADRPAANRCRNCCYKPRGLVLVTGPTGSGKTTTLASMINIINEERDEAHIITIEDPIEYYHKHKKAAGHPARSPCGRAEFRRGAAPRVAAGPGHDSGRRNARPGNDGSGHHGGGNRALGVRHAAHHRRGQDH